MKMTFGGIRITQHDILYFLDHQDSLTPVTSKEIAENLNISLVAVSKNLKRLRDNKQINYFSLYNTYFYIPKL